MTSILKFPFLNFTITIEADEGSCGSTETHSSGSTGILTTQPWTHFCFPRGKASNFMKGILCAMNATSGSVTVEGPHQVPSCCKLLEEVVHIFFKYSLQDEQIYSFPSTEIFLVLQCSSKSALVFKKSSSTNLKTEVRYKSLWQQVQMNTGPSTICCLNKETEFSGLSS